MVGARGSVWSAAEERWRAPLWVVSLVAVAATLTAAFVDQASDGDTDKQVASEIDRSEPPRVRQTGTAVLEIRVTGGSNSAVVEILDDAGSVFSRVDVVAGPTWISGLGAGEYDLRVTAPGEEPVNASVVIDADGAGTAVVCDLDVGACAGTSSTAGTIPN